MAACNTEGVLLKAEEPKVIEVPNFSRLHTGYVEGGLYLQNAALKTMVVRVFPCGRRNSGTKDYVCILFKKQWIRNFPLNFHCTVSILDVEGGRKYSQTYGMEGFEELFEIDRFVKRSTLFENSFELLPNDTLTVLCEVSYTMSSTQKSSKIWSILGRLIAWNPPKKDLSEIEETEQMCSLVVETMDGGEFLLLTPTSYFKTKIEDTVSSGEVLCESIQKYGNSKMSTLSSVERSVKNECIESQGVNKMSSSNNTQTALLKNSLKKDSKFSNKKDLSTFVSNIREASEHKDTSGLFSSITAVLSSKNLLSEKGSEKAFTKESIPLRSSNSRSTSQSSFTAKNLFDASYKNKTLAEVQNPDHAMLSEERMPDIKKSGPNVQTKVKRIKSKPEPTVASNTKILDLGSRKTVQGYDVCEASPVFNRMLKTTMLENSTRRIKLKNVDADTFDNFLYYLETREIIAENFEKLCDLYEMADQYEVMYLMSDCAIRMFQSIDEHNFLVILELANMHGDDNLKRKVHKFFLKNEIEISRLLQDDPEFFKWYESWKKEDISTNIEASDEEIEINDTDLDFYR